MIRLNKTVRAGRLLALAIGIVAAITASVAPADTTSMLNRAGRLFGFGWGDGYHGCRDGTCRPGADLPPRGFSEQFGKARPRRIGHGGIFPPNTALTPVTKRRQLNCDSTAVHHEIESGSASILIGPSDLSVEGTQRGAVRSTPSPQLVEPSDDVELTEEAPIVGEEFATAVDDLVPAQDSLESSDFEPIEEQTLPPAWEDEAYGEVKRLPLLDDDSAAADPIGQPELLTQEAESPSDLSLELPASNDLLPDTDLLPAPEDRFDDLLLEENDVESTPAVPPTVEDVLTDELEEVVRPPFVEQLPVRVEPEFQSQVIPSWNGSVVRTNPYVRANVISVGRERKSATRSERTSKLAAPRTLARPSSHGPTRKDEQRAWLPVKQPQ